MASLLPSFEKGGNNQINPPLLPELYASLAASRFFMNESIKNGIFHTNDVTANILLGITRDTVFTLASDLGYKYKIDKISQDDLFNADEVFLTSSSSCVTPITKIDSKLINEGKIGKITLNLAELYSKSFMHERN